MKKLGLFLLIFIISCAHKVESDFARLFNVANQIGFDITQKYLTHESNIKKLGIFSAVFAIAYSGHKFFKKYSDLDSFNKLLTKFPKFKKFVDENLKDSQENLITFLSYVGFSNIEKVYVVEEEYYSKNDPIARFTIVIKVKNKLFTLQPSCKLLSPEITFKFLQFDILTDEASRSLDLYYSMIEQQPECIKLVADNNIPVTSITKIDVFERVDGPLVIHYLKDGKEYCKGFKLICGKFYNPQNLSDMPRIVPKKLQQLLFKYPYLPEDWKKSLNYYAALIDKFPEFIRLIEENNIPIEGIIKFEKSKKNNELFFIIHYKNDGKELKKEFKFNNQTKLFEVS